jgi:nicotinamidase-related amidase/type 1 glutamine amidotransferase
MKLNQVSHGALYSIVFFWTFDGIAASPPLTLHTRNRVESAPSSGDWQPVERQTSLAPEKTAIVICDMWDKHWCAGATRRVAEMAPRMNEVIVSARARGVFIIHCPSDTMKFYADTPQRKLAQAAPKALPKVPLKNWCHLDPGKEAPLPIDDSDGGCDDWPQCKTYSAWKQQIPAITIHDGDAVTDSAEAYYLMEQRGIENVIVMGVHLNMCVLGRPFSIRQMVAQGKQVYLMRDMTDTMYNSRARPYVPHCAGTDLMIAHVEKYWCPTVASTDFTGKPAFRFSEDRRPQVVFLIGEDEYKTWETLPAFAKTELEWRGLNVSVIQQDTENKHRFPGFSEAMRQADLLLVSVRRRALPKEQLDAVRAHLAAGKPLIGIRTASHAFAPRNEDAQLGDAWVTFDPDVLGGNYVGHHGNGPNTVVTVAPGAQSHPVLRGVDATTLVGHGSLYRVSPLKEGTVLLLVGTIEGKPAEPVAWINKFGEKNAAIFYTSLGHPDDFKDASFRRLLVNAILQSVGQPVPPQTVEAKTTR